MLSGGARVTLKFSLEAHPAGRLAARAGAPSHLREWPERALPVEGKKTKFCFEILTLENSANSQSRREWGVIFDGFYVWVNAFPKSFFGGSFRSKLLHGLRDLKDIVHVQTIFLQKERLCFDKMQCYNI